MSVEVLGRTDRLPAVEARTGEPIVFRIRFLSPDIVKHGGVELGIRRLEGVRLIPYSTRPVTTFDLPFVPFVPGENVVELTLDWLPLAAGEYVLTVGLTRPIVEWLLREQELARFIVSENDVFGSGMPIVAERALVVVPHTCTRPAVP